VPTENVELARRIAERMGAGDFVAALADEERFGEMAAALEPFVEPEFEIEMIGPEYQPQRLAYRGLDGYVEAWRDWLAPYESYRAELEEFVDAGDRVVLLVRQVGRTKGPSVPIEAESAVVFVFRAGKLARLEFHLDRERARKAAGLSE
jgi:ketosteroid isomerase-like protein